ncbi:trehalase family glycosidase [Chishuiella sp.]|uniref:trehalase family glycosidase n=1 Tax=Chishuiella sp. TaxID=1969467 RepID=UPI0028A90240|nr:trehalase family glycosidase [Chishuiella sp.]
MSQQLYINDINELFDNVQRSKIFVDQKTMTDAIPKFSIDIIKKNYQNQKTENSFNLKDFVLKHFDFPEKIEVNDNFSKVSIEDHIERLWNHLTKESIENRGTLLHLPKSYIVPGGRFNEFFYWDSYFVMLGLKESNHTEMMQNIVDNCAYLISEFGFVPNASRTYFLSRSQPPYFSLMVQLLAEATNDLSVYSKYFQILEKEYQFWMEGENELENNKAINHLVKLSDGTVLNRYFDSENIPRPESYSMDLEDQEKSDNQYFYQNIRSACESGWDFSSRWFSDYKTIETITTLNILPVDLNSLLFNLEDLLAKIAKSIGETSEKVMFYEKRAKDRVDAIQKYFWDENTKIYRDFNFKINQKTLSEHVGMFYPLYFGISSSEQANGVEQFIKANILYDGGLVTTTNQSGQQWDLPNAWAPFQWLGYEAMIKYNFNSTAQQIAKNWCGIVEKIYNETGKLMEKYNAVDTSLLAGGGEYPNQDGFGWTNGIYLYLKNRIK